jgi:predicted RNA binding protein YcfA (HicA-like mRNA interferase family)
MLGGKKPTVPRHPTQEIKAGTLNAILRDLGLKR